MAWADMYYHRKTKRDLEARRAYMRDKSGPSSREEIFILDILRGEVDEHDLRI